MTRLYLILYTLTTALLCMCAITPCNAQGIDIAKAEIARVRSMPPSMERDSIRVHNYNYLAEAYSGRNDSLVLRYIDTLARLKETGSWSKSAGLYHRAIGKYHDRRGEFEKALSAYTLAIQAFEKAGDKSEYIVYTTILKAFVLNNNGMHTSALEMLERIQPLAKTLENKNCLAWIIDAFGDHHFYSSFRNQDFEKALGYYLQVEAILPQVTNPMIVADNAHCLAGCYIRLGDEEKAIEYRDKALRLAEEHGFKNIVFAVYGDMADVYEERGDFDEAIRYRQLSLDYARQADWIEMEARAERNMTYTYKNAGDYQNALAHFEAYIAIEDSLSRFEVQQRYAELEAQYALGKKDLEIEKLKAQNLLFLRNVLILLLLAGIGFLVYYTAVNKQLKKQNQALIRKNEEILMARTEGQNLERKRMAAELHDNINAKIAATKWMLETLNSPEKSPEERDIIDGLVKAMGDIYEDVRFISHNLVPKDIETKTLEALVNQLVQNLNQNQKIRFTVATSGTPRVLSNAMKLQSYGMIMELVNNIIKHSNCRNAKISVQYLSEAVAISVNDDGRGFDPAATHSGTGLRSIRARVETISGTMHLDTDPTRGTEVAIRMPYIGQEVSVH